MRSSDITRGVPEPRIAAARLLREYRASHIRSRQQTGHLDPFRGCHGYGAHLVAAGPDFATIQFEPVHGGHRLTYVRD